MGNINCKDSHCSNPQNEEINCLSSSITKPDQPLEQVPEMNQERGLSLEIPIQNNNNPPTLLTPIQNKSIDFSQYDTNNNPITESGPHQIVTLSLPQSSIGSLTPIRKQSTMKHSEGRKMPLEVIDEINGEMINVNTYEAIPPQNQIVNQNTYEAYKTSPSISSKKKTFAFTKKKNWKEMKITSIIPEEKLQNAGKNDILFQGEFYKFTKENDIKKIDATSKYLILTRSELRIYRSKEIVLHMLSPLQRISLFNISQCDIINVPNNKKLKNLCRYNFCIQFITVNGMKIDSDDKLSTNSSHRLENSFYKNNNAGLILSTIGGERMVENNTNKNQKDKNGKKTFKGKKMQLISQDEKNPENHSKKEKFLFNNNSELIIFSSDNEDLVNKWVCVVNYFLTR